MGELSRVAREGDPFRVRQMLEDGIDPNASEGPNPKLPLHCAVAAGHEVCVRLLVEFGADLNAPDGNNRFPLEAAKSFEMRRLLLSLGAKPDLPRKGKMTPAAFFATFGDRKLVDLFLSFGASAEEKIRDGRTIRELLDVESHWNDPQKRFRRPDSLERASQKVRELSNDLQISPEEFVARHRGILIWGFGANDLDDPALTDWARRVGQLLQSATLLEQAYLQFLTGEELKRALDEVRQEQRRESDHARIKELQEQYALKFPAVGEGCP